MIVIRAFRAPESPETCAKYIEGHQRLLELHYGIIKVSSGKTDWTTHHNTIVIVAESEDGTKVYGGARLQVADGVVPLPIETAIGKYDPNIHQMAVNGSSELCGLWNSIEVAGMGIGSVFLVRVAVVMALQLSSCPIFMLCAPVTVKMGKRIGGEIETTLGDNGHFIYPKEDLIATALVVKDCETLSKATDIEREKIFSLYQNPEQKIIEQGPKNSISIDYRVKI